MTVSQAPLAGLLDAVLSLFAWCAYGAAMMSLAACSTPDTAQGIRVGLITPGSIADAAWNSGAYQGLQQIRDSLGLAVSHVEARTPSEQDEALRTYAAQGYDLVFAHGFEFQDPAERVSAQYPKTVFIVTSGRRAKGNVAPLIFRLEEASYLAGMVAGGLTRKQRPGVRGRDRAPPDRGRLPGVGERRPGDQPEGRDPEDLPQQLRRRGGRPGGGTGPDPGRGRHVPPQCRRRRARASSRPPRRPRGSTSSAPTTTRRTLAPERVIGSAVIDLPRAFLTVASEVKAGTFQPKVEAFGLVQRGDPVRAEPRPGDHGAPRPSAPGSRPPPTRSPPGP